MAVDEPRPTAGGGVKSEIIEIGDRQSAEAHIVSFVNSSMN
jgi:hypothetical protein